MPEIETRTFHECLKTARTAAGFATREQTYGIPLSITSIGRHERGEKEVTASDVMMYAECYNAPELMVQYCCTACPIGRRSQPLSGRSVALLSVRLYNILRSVSDQAERLMRIADDDVVDATERDEFDRIVVQVKNLRSVADELELYAMRLRGGRLGKTGAAIGRKTTW